MTVRLILSQLKSFRFVLVKPNAKEAFEAGLPSYAWDDPKLAQHLEEGGNYGVLAGHEHALIDTDDPELEAEIRAKLPLTFEVQSPRGGTHFYFECKTPESSKTIPVLDKTRPKDQWNIGHVRIGNGYLVGPYSTFNGKQYLVKQARPLSQITEQQIRQVLTPWQAVKAAKIEQEYVKSQGYRDLTFPITAILDLSKLKKSGDTYQGPHPVHGSTTGTNFHVDTQLNVWYCFRCCVGGGPLQLLAVLEDRKDCDLVNPLRGEDFKRILDIAVAKRLIEKAKKSPEKKDRKDKTEPIEYPWKPVTTVIPCLDMAALYDSLVAWLKRYVDFRQHEYYHVLAAWIMASWLIEDWRATGPLYLLGPINSGKSTVLECLEETACRGVRGGSMSNSTMFRLSHAYTPAFLIDEAQIYNRDEWAETQAFLNERYRKGGKVWRIVGEGRNMIPQFFNAFGATAYASSYPPWPALTSRALTFHMAKNTRSVEQTLTPQFEEEGQKWRNLLAGFREKQLGIPLPTYPEMEKLKDYRTREIGQSLIAVASEGEAHENILRYLVDLEKEHQVEEETSELADIVRAVDLCEPQNGRVSVKEVREKLADVLGEVELRVRRGVLGEEPERIVNERALPKPRQVTAMLVTLGFPKTHVHGHLTGILWDARLLDELKRRYGISPLSPPSPPASVKAGGEEGDEGDSGGRASQRLRETGNG